MSPTLLEGAIALLLVWFAWRIGALLAPRVLHRFRRRRPPGQDSSDHSDKQPPIIDV
jgi:hypothetical protein